MMCELPPPAAAAAAAALGGARLSCGRFDRWPPRCWQTDRRPCQLIVICHLSALQTPAPAHTPMQKHWRRAGELATRKRVGEGWIKEGEVRGPSEERSNIIAAFHLSTRENPGLLHKTFWMSYCVCFFLSLCYLLSFFGTKYYVH